MDEEIEVNFRLDADGRTSLDAPSEIDYTTRATATQIVVGSADNHSTTTPVDDALYDELLLDCEIADSALLPRTFWMPANGKPRCSLEQMAKDVFDHHVGSSGAHTSTATFDATTSGAEWWVQLRPSPPAGRYSMHDPDHGSSNGISFHWDKDEDLRILCGGTTYVHPHLSTVTYLTATGAPTLVAESYRVHNLTGEWMVPKDDAVGEESVVAAAFVSWPAQGKHLCFDGRFLHAAPSDLQEEGVWAKQCRIPQGLDEDRQKKQTRRHRRCTFLVNIWLNYKPFNVNLFPETMIDKLSGYSNDEASTNTKTSSQRMRLSFVNKDGHYNVKKVTVLSDKKVQLDEGFDSQDQTEGDENVQQFTWPMGAADSGETIQITIPLRRVRAEANRGGNLRICWGAAGKRRHDDNESNMGMFLIKKQVYQEKLAESKRSRLEGEMAEPINQESKV